MAVIDKLTYQIERILPAVYSDTMSHQKLVNEVTKKLNELIDEFNLYFGEDMEKHVSVIIDELDKSGRLAEIINVEIFGQLNDEIKALDGALGKKASNLDIGLTVTVGAGGDYATINEALEDVSKNHVTYKNSGVNVEIRLKAGFVMREQILVNGIDLGWIVITGEEVETIIDRASLVTLFGAENKYPAFGASNGGVLPIIGTQFYMNETGAYNTSRDGVYLERESSAIILSGCGIRNAGGFGIRGWDNCRIQARGANFSQAHERGCMISQGTIMNAPEINLSHAKGRNTFRAYRNARASLENANLSYGAEVNARISESSQVDLQGADLSYAGQVNSEGAGNALFAYGSASVYLVGANLSHAKGTALQVSNSAIVSANETIIQNAGGYGINAYGNGTVYAVNADVSGATLNAIRASSGARIDAGSADVRNCKGASGVLAEYGGQIVASSLNSDGNAVGIQASRGGKVTGASMTANNCGVGLHSFWQGEIDARDVKAMNCRDKGAEVATGSKLVATQGDFSGATNYGVHVFRGSDAMLYGARCRKGTTDQVTDITCTSGSIVRANDTIGGTNLTPNEVSAEGIIFKN